MIFMTRSFTSFALTRDDIGVVYPLVHTTIPEIDLARWQSFARRIVGEEALASAGAVGLRNAAGYNCGLFAFHVERDLRHGSVLAIDLFIALDLISEDEATEALLYAAEAKARELKCLAIHIRVDATQKSIADRITAAGHHREGTLFCKRLEPAPPPN
jgi:hypothetical protein